jgi:hypothetical protein
MIRKEYQYIGPDDYTDKVNWLNCQKPGLIDLARVSKDKILNLGALFALLKTRASESPSGFFTVAKRGGWWWFITPRGERFFSLGINHIDFASLRYQDNQDIWRDRYGNSMKRWLSESVRENLKSWGINNVGWVQEVVTRDEKNQRHSRNFTFEEYQWLDLPYCHMLPFVDFHQWEVETRNPDLHDKGFEEWCDYVARAHCSRFAGDAKLISYFYSDCPTWIHVRKDSTWKDPLFDPERLKTEADRRELFHLADRYYKVTHDAIRRYDPHHLILGDRYEANAPLPEQVISAAVPYVDVLSFQCIGGAGWVREHLGRWAALFQRPILLADSASCTRKVLLATRIRKSTDG